MRAAAPLLLAAAAGAAPTGQYCANVMGVADVKMTITDATHLTAVASVFGDETKCAEPFTFDAATGEMKLTNWGKDDDCIYKLANGEGGVDSVDIKYDGGKDILSVDVGITQFDLKKCPSVSAATVTPPSGKYCANVMGVADVTMSIVDATHLNAVASVFGDETKCAEPYTFDAASGAIKLTNWGKDDDCIYKLANGEGGVDSVDIKYNAGADTLSVDAGIAQFDLKKCPSPALRGAVA